GRDELLHQRRYRPRRAGDRQHLLCAGTARHRLQQRGEGADDRPRDRLRVPPDRVQGRQPQRAQPGGDGEAGCGPRGRDPRRPDHLDRPCPRHRPVLDPRLGMGSLRWRSAFGSDRREIEFANRRTSMIARLTLAATAFVSLAAPALAAGPDNRIAPEARIRQMSEYLEAVPDADRGVFIRGYTGQWYYAAVQGQCPR